MEGSNFPSAGRAEKFRVPGKGLVDVSFGRPSAYERAIHTSVPPMFTW